MSPFAFAWQRLPDRRRCSFWARGAIGIVARDGSVVWWWPYTARHCVGRAHCIAAGIDFVDRIADRRAIDGRLTAEFRLDVSEIVTHAVRLLVGNAVGARRSSIWDFCSPGLLQEHLVAAALGSSCSVNEVDRQAGRFRWIDVMRDLTEFAGPRTEPHADSAKWVERGLVLPGNVDEQLESLGRHPTMRADDRAMILGSGSGRSASEVALNGLGVDPRDEDAMDRLFEELGWSAG